MDTFNNTYKTMNFNKYERKVRGVKLEMQKMQQRIDYLKDKKYEQKQFYSKKFRNVEMQMFSMAMPALSTASSMFMNYKIGKVASESSNAVKSIIPQLEATLTNFNSCFTQCKNALFKTANNVLNVVDVAIDIISALLQVSFAKTNCKIASFTVEIVRLVKKYCTMDISFDKIRELIFGMNNCKDVSMQVGEINLETFKDILTPAYIVTGLFVALFGIFMGTVPTSSDIMAVTKKMGQLGRDMKGMHDMNNVLQVYVSAMLDYFGVNVLKMRTDNEINAVVEGYNDWCKDVQDLVGHKVNVNGSFEPDTIVAEIMKDCNKILEVENLYKKGMEISRSLAESKLPQKLMVGFNIHMQHLTRVFSAVDTSGAFGTKPRTQPLVLWMFGESGVGKSGMSWPLSLDLNNLYVKDPEEAKNFTKYVYFRNVEQKHWNAFNSQNIVIYDDFGQMKDSQGNPNTEFIEIIRAANIAPYPLHMAHLEDKRKAKFTAKVIMLTSNVFEQEVNSLTFPDAFRRRIDLCCRVKCRPEFTKTCWSSAQGMYVQRLDKEKVKELTGNLLSTVVYLVDLINPETGDEIEGMQNLTYEQFLDIAKDQAVRNKENSAGMNEFLMTYAEQRKKDPKWTCDKKIDFEPIVQRNAEQELVGNLASFRREQEVTKGMTKQQICNHKDMLSNKFGAIKKEMLTTVEKNQHVEDLNNCRKDELVAQEILQNIPNKLKVNKDKRCSFFKKVELQIAYTDGEIEEILEENPDVMVRLNNGETITEILYNKNGERVEVNELQYMLATATSLEETAALLTIKLYRKVKNNVKKFSQIYVNSKKILEEWRHDMLKYVKNHPWQVFAGLFGAFVGVLCISKFWNYLFGKQEKSCNNQNIESQDFVNLGNVLIVPFNVEEQNVWNGVENYYDLSRFGKEAQISLIDKNEISACKVRFVHKDFVQQLNEVNKSRGSKTIVLTMQKKVKLDKEYNLKISKINSFKDIETEIATPINYGRQQDGSWKYPDNKMNMWDEMGRPRMLGIFPDMSGVPGMNPTKEFPGDLKMEATSSGDCMTLKHKQRVLEASLSGDSAKVLEATASGDSVTMKQFKPKMLEAAVLGDNITTKQFTHKSLEASSSGDAVTQKSSVKKMVEGLFVSNVVEAEMQMWKDQVAQKLISNRVLSNMYKICLVRGDKRIPLVNGLFVKSNIMLVPGHLLGFIGADDEIEIRNLFDVTFKMPFNTVKIIDITNALDESKEAALLQFPKFVCAHSDLVKHFSDAESMSKYRRAEITLPTIRYSEKLGQLVTTLLECDKCTAYESEVQLHDATKGIYTLRRGLEYHLPTIAGDCGAPVIINETQVLRKIAGIHVAGDKDGNAYAESITRGDLLRALKKIDVSMQISLDLDTTVDLTGPMKSIPIGEEITSDFFSDMCDLPAKKFLPVGKLSTPLFEPGKTELRHSLVYGKISTIKTKPAYLTNRFMNGQFINMKHKNLMKCAMDTPYINEDLIEKAYVFTRAKWLQNMRPELRRVLTFDEAIMGRSDISEYIGPINRSSSPGFPWINMREKGTKGKQGWFGDNEYIINDEVKQAVEHRINKAREGVRVPVLWVDTLKDERRPIEKVEALKTRVFSNGPMDFSICFRMYFLGFIAHLMENRINNEVSVGTNVFSQDWAKTVRKLQQKGQKVIAGDFSTFDGSLNVCMMKKFVCAANEFYSDGNDLIRLVLMDDVINSAHICGDAIYLWTHSQPSGNPATTILNCFINSMGLRMCFEECAKAAFIKMTMRDFDKHVSMVSYGDDNVINFSDEVSEWFNMDTIAQAFAKFGFTYTDELKGAGGVVPKWRRIEDVQYLKRNFRFDKDRRVWEAPLCMDTILEMPNWCRGSLDIQEGTKLNCENAIMELSMHEKPVFDKWSKVIQDAYVESTSEYLQTDTYLGYAQHRYMEYYQG